MRSTLLVLVTCLAVATHGLADQIQESPSGPEAESRWERLHPDYLVFQTGGYTGLLSAGIGYRFLSYLVSDVSAGYVPKSVGGTTIRSLAWKTGILFCGFNEIHGVSSVLRAGLGLLYGIDKDLFVTLPGHYPPGYYPATAFRFIEYLAIEFEFGPKHNLYLEYTVHDSGLFRYMESERLESIAELGTYAVGYRLWMP